MYALTAEVRSYVPITGAVTDVNSNKMSMSPFIVIIGRSKRSVISY